MIRLRKDSLHCSAGEVGKRWQVQGSLGTVSLFSPRPVFPLGLQSLQRLVSWQTHPIISLIAGTFIQCSKCVRNFTYTFIGATFGRWRDRG